MRIDLYGITFETPAVTFYLWSPWRASFIEHRMFDALASLPNSQLEKLPDERRLTIADAKSWRTALVSISRVLKGWQEEAEAGSERRMWRWLLEADTDANGYDHAGEKTSAWGFLRLSIDRGSPGDAEKGEDIDLHEFGLRIAAVESGQPPN